MERDELTFRESAYFLPQGRQASTHNGAVFNRATSPKSSSSRMSRDGLLRVILLPAFNPLCLKSQVNLLLIRSAMNAHFHFLPLGPAGPVLTPELCF
jgi:hypothetical protein